MGRRDTVPPVRRAVVQHRRPAWQYLVRVLRRAVVVEGVFPFSRFALIPAICAAWYSRRINGRTEKMGKNTSPLIIVFNSHIERASILAHFFCTTINTAGIPSS